MMSDKEMLRFTIELRVFSPFWIAMHHAMALEVLDPDMNNFTSRIETSLQNKC